jgi:hypothetical protein
MEPECGRIPAVSSGRDPSGTDGCHRVGRYANAPGGSGISRGTRRAGADSGNGLGLD